MSREIKFRAWDGQEMLLFALFEKPWPYNSENPVMQFTGLKDKNGKEIYEGDVVKIEGSSRPMVMEYHNGSFLLERIYGGAEAYRMKVIGNIYENPELIKP